jgi:hypothetical protein
MLQKRNSDSIKIDPKVKDVLLLIGAGSFLAASVLMPGLPLLAKPFLDKKREEERNQWKKYNNWRLKQVLKRLHEQKLVEILETKDGYTVKVTEKGRRRRLKYNLDELMLTNKKWDKKWRIIVYDVDESKKPLRNVFQKVLRKLEFLQIQKSVYLTPYPCEDEIEYLRQIYGIGPEVVLLTIAGLENEQAYKEYFGLS